MGTTNVKIMSLTMKGLWANNTNWTRHFHHSAEGMKRGLGKITSAVRKYIKYLCLSTTNHFNFFLASL